MKRIAIAGVGGIGSNVAVNLVRSGIDRIRLIDFDRVEPSNLNRQFYFHDQIGALKVDMLAINLRRIHPTIDIEAIAARIDAGNCAALLSGCALVVEGFDRGPDKKMLIETMGDNHIVVAACGIAGRDLETIRVRRLANCYVVGDFRTDCSQAPLFSHKVTAVANRMTDIILAEGGYYDRT